MRRTHLAGGGGRNQGQLLSLSHAAAAVSFKTAHPSLEIMASAARARGTEVRSVSRRACCSQSWTKARCLGQRRWGRTAVVVREVVVIHARAVQRNAAVGPVERAYSAQQVALGFRSDHPLLHPPCERRNAHPHVSTNAVGLSPPPTQSIEIRAYRPRARAG